MTKKRLAYVKELQKYVDVDIYGPCGIPCTLNGRDNSGGLCVPTEPYRFYLAFENSFCDAKGIKEYDIYKLV